LVPLSIDVSELVCATLPRTARSIGYHNRLKAEPEEKKLIHEKAKKHGNLDLFTKLD
jgi:hypothetical protein